MPLTDSLAKVPFAVALPLSLISTIGSIALSVWLTTGTKGLFWGAFGNRQFLYYAIVGGVILIAVCGAWFVRLTAAPFVALCGAGGYFGGVIGYCCLAHASLAQMMAKGHYYAIVWPL